MSSDTIAIDSTVATAAAAGTPRPGREIARIAMPVSAEFVLTLALSFVNQIVVGALGAVAIAAVGYANSLTMILFLTLGALGASASILVAREYGAGRGHRLSSIVATAVSLAVGVAALAAVPVVLWAEGLLRLTGASPGVTVTGAPYLRFMALALIPNVLAAVLSGVLRSTGNARSPMFATMATVSLNVPLAFALVLGIGPFPQLGVAGAGLATLVTTSAKAAVLIWQTYVHHRVARFVRPSGRSEWSTVLAPLFVLALPLGITELFWTSGTFLYNVVFQRIGDEALAAAQIVTTLEGIFMVGSIGLMSATTALVGRSIGQGDPHGAKLWVARVCRAGRHTGLVFGLLFALSAFALGLLFGNAGPEVQQLAVMGILVNATFQVVKVRNMILGAGALPSGNDVRGVIMGDVVGAFGVGLPLAVLLGLFTPLGVLGVFLGRAAEELVKLPIFSYRIRRVDWHALAATA